MEKDMSGDGDLSLQIEKVFIISTFRQLELRIKPWNHRSELTLDAYWSFEGLAAYTSAWYSRNRSTKSGSSKDQYQIRP